LSFVLIETITAAMRTTHHIVIPRAALDWDCDRQRARAFKLRSFDIDRAVVVVQSQREIISQRGIFDLRQSPRLLQHLLLKRAAALLVIALQTDIERNRDRVFWIEAGPHLLSGLQTAHNKTGADEQDQRKADLRHNEKVPQT